MLGTKVEMNVASRRWTLIYIWDVRVPRSSQRHNYLQQSLTSNASQTPLLHQQDTVGEDARSSIDCVLTSKATNEQPPTSYDAVKCGQKEPIRHVAH